MDDTYVPEAARSGTVNVRGTTIDRYLVLHRLGRGGMGEVYAAYDERLDRRVALKVVHQRGDQSAARAQLQALLLHEAQAMAQLHHPNVVTVHDALVVDGDVIVSMEYVEGQTVREWLEAAPRAASEVVSVFLQAGRGLQAAHHAGVIHRDFKPDNVLVGGAGAVKVADFGLALPAAASSGGEGGGGGAARTQWATGLGSSSASWICGTPAYMAPELLDGHPANERTDQFAFAVALCEALCGQRPTRARSLEERLAQKHEPVQVPEDTRLPAAVRKVLVRALSRDPAERFESMAALLEALEPRAGRAKWPLAAGAALTLAAATGAWWMLANPDPCADAEARAAAAWNDGRRAQLTAAFEKTDRAYAAAALESVTQALDGWRQGWTQGWTSACHAARTAGPQGAPAQAKLACYSRQLSQVASLTGLLATADGPLVEKAPAGVRMAARADECERDDGFGVFPAAPKDSATQLKVAALEQTLDKLWARFSAGQYAAALPDAIAAVEEATAAQHPPTIAEARLLEGGLLRELGRFPEAAASLRVALNSAIAGTDFRRAVKAGALQVHTVGSDLGRFDEAEALIGLVDALLDRMGRPAELTASFDSDKGSVYRAEGKAKEAVATHQEAVALLRGSKSADELELSVTLNNLAVALQDVGRLEEAAVNLEEARALRERVVGPDHPWMLPILNNLAGLWNEKDEPARAVPYLERALALYRRLYGDDGPRLALLQGNLARSHCALGHDALCESLALESIERSERLQGPNHPDLGFRLTLLGKLYYRQGEPMRARPVLERAMAIWEKAGAKAARTAETRFALAQVLAEEPAQHARAKVLAEQALGTWTDPGTASPKMADKAQALLARLAQRR